MEIPSITLNTGRSMPILGLGTWNLRGAEGEQAVTWALEAGYRHFDTAKIYNTEAEVGRAIAKSQLPRSEIFVTTKLWPNDFSDPEQALTQSLANLQMDYVDLYLIHWPRGDARLAVWRQMEEFFRDGRCRAIGVSNYGISLLEQLLASADVPPAVNQIEVNPESYDPELIAYCQGQNIAVVAYSPLGEGRTVHDPAVKNLATKYHKTPAQVLIRWCIQHDLATIPRSSNHQRIIENTQVFNFELEPKDMTQLDKLS